MSATLLDIISRNKDTEIGKKWNFESINTVDDYRRNVPLTDYEDYRPYIERMVDSGEENLLTAEKVVFYVPSSGTTSKSKLIPKFVDPASTKNDFKFEQSLLLMCAAHDAQTPLGVPIVPCSNAAFKPMIDHNPSQFIAPREAYEITDFPTALYIQVLFGLRTSIKSIFAALCPTVLAAFNILKQEWEQMASDIRNGTLKSSLKLTDSQRSALEEAMGGADPQRADEIVKIMCQSDFKSVAHRLWLDLTLFFAITGGSFATYIPKLQYFLGDKIDMRSLVYVASEGMFGVNKCMNSHTSAYSLQTHSIFLEFIPIADADNPKCTLLAE